MNTKSSPLIQLRGYRRKKYWKEKWKRTLNLFFFPFLIVGIFLISVLTLVAIVLTDLFIRQTYQMILIHPVIVVFLAATTLGILLQWSLAWREKRSHHQGMNYRNSVKRKVRLAVIER